MEPKHALPHRLKVGQVVTVNNTFSIIFKSPEMRPQHRTLFSFIPRMSNFRGSYTSTGDTANVF